MGIHKNLPSTQCHEDKLIIDAVTTDAGKVITPSSVTDAEGVLRNLTVAEVDLAVPDYGVRGITNNATVIAMTAAADSTFNTNTDYVKVTLTATLEENNGVSQNNSALKVSKAGIYVGSSWASIKSSVANTRVAVKAVINDTTFQPRKLISNVPTTTEELALSASGMFTLSALDEVSLYIAADKNCNLTIVDAHQSLHSVDLS